MDENVKRYSIGMTLGTWEFSGPLITIVLCMCGTTRNSKRFIFYPLYWINYLRLIIISLLKLNDF